EPLKGRLPICEDPPLCRYLQIGFVLRRGACPAAPFECVIEVRNLARAILQRGTQSRYLAAEALYVRDVLCEIAAHVGQLCSSNSQLAGGVLGLGSFLGKSLLELVDGPARFI